ncbi:hypothetical protein [Aquipuribacter sp. SD81]|uniref:hypothetical protein n=1 Tax=Aquipuribacter sp. SD81 TaxID=3127703 RepID=UPI00301B08E4
MVGTAAAVALGVVLVRGGTAVDADDLAAARAEAAPTPSASATEDDGPDPVLLSANGLPTLRLGAAPGPGTRTVPEAFVTPDRTACGYVVPDVMWGEVRAAPEEGDQEADAQALNRLVQDLEVRAWLVDGTVESVRLQAWSPPAQALDGVRSWAGVTIGSPIEVAAELPGARTTRERPWPDQPPVTVVRVPLRGGGTELVAADAQSWSTEAGQEAAGRVTSLELRSAAGAACTREATQQWQGRTDDEVTLVGADGSVAGVQVGADADALAAAGVLQPQEDELPDAGGCRWWTAEGGRHHVVSHDGVVTRLHVGTAFRLVDDVGSGSTAAELLASPLGAATTTSPHLAPTGSTAERTMVEAMQLAYVHLETTVLEVSLFPEHRAVPEAGAIVPGGELRADSLSVLLRREAGQDPWVC